MSLTGRGNVWKGVLSNRVGTVSVLLTESNDSVLRNRLARPRKKPIGGFDCKDSEKEGRAVLPTVPTRAFLSLLVTFATSPTFSPWQTWQNAQVRNTELCASLHSTQLRTST